MQTGIYLFEQLQSFPRYPMLEYNTLVFLSMRFMLIMQQASQKTSHLMLFCSQSIQI